MAVFNAFLLLLAFIVCADATCSTTNLVDSHDERFSWMAIVNGEHHDSLLDPHDKHVVKTDTAANTVRANIRINYALLKPHEVMIETRNAVLVKLQNYNRHTEPTKGVWYNTTFIFMDEDILADKMVFSVTGPAGEVEIRNIYVKGCLKINPCYSYLSDLLETRQKEFYNYHRMGDKDSLLNFFTEPTVLIDEGVDIVQGQQDVLDHYERNQHDLASDVKVIVLRAVQLSEYRAYTVHVVVVYKEDGETLKHPTTRLLTIWSKEDNMWKVDVQSKSTGAPLTP